MQVYTHIVITRKCARTAIQVLVTGVPRLRFHTRRWVCLQVELPDGATYQAKCIEATKTGQS